MNNKEVKRNGQCDDGNIVSGYGCSNICITEFCGYGTINNGEE